MKMTSLFAAVASAVLLSSAGGLRAADAAPTAPPPLRVLYFTCGGYHDYTNQAPFLTTNLTRLINVKFDVVWGIDLLNYPKFADNYDAVFYNVCDDMAPDQELENAMKAARGGKPTVMIHCSVHAFRKSPIISEWEVFCGMRSKVHDHFGPFTVTNLAPDDPITKSFPKTWKTSGDELYQTISIPDQSHQLLKAKSPLDGREHVVCWTSQFGEGRVFCTTLGHDMKTMCTPEYLHLLANGLLWSCGKLNPDGTPAPGYAAPVKP